MKVPWTPMLGTFQPARRQIIEQLTRGELTAGEIVAGFAATSAACSVTNGALRPLG